MNIDLDNLAKEFNIDETEEIHFDRAIDIEKAIESDNTDPDKIISDTIGKANAILDRVISEINSSGMSPRLGEVAGQLVQAINSSAGFLYTKNFNLDNLMLKNRSIELKEREVRLKELMLKKPEGNTINNNLIITDRESVMKMLKESKAQLKLIEST